MDAAAAVARTRVVSVVEGAAVVGYVNAVVFATVACLAVRHWRSDRTDAARWLAVALCLIGVAAVAGVVMPDEVSGLVPLVAQRILVLAIAGYVWALVRFVDSFDAAARLSRLADVGGLSIALAVLALPELPAGDGPRPWWFQTFVLAFLLYWVVAHAVVAVRLWRAGSQLPAVSGRRVRFLAFSAALLALVLLPAGAATGAGRSTIATIAAFLPMVAAAGLYLGLAAPRWLKSIWREPELAAMRQALVDVMAMPAPAEVAAALLPHAAQVLGAQAATLFDGEGAVLAMHRSGAVDDSTERLSVDAGPMRLEVDGGAYTALFKRDDADLLHGVAAMIEIAVERASALEREQHSRHEAEATAAELEALVFGFSHDLKSPVISLLGYLDYFEEDHGAALDDEGRFFVERMRSSAMYMQDLISDLLELSRVGRVETEADDVALADILAAVRNRCRGSFPDGNVVVVEPLPVVKANPVRLQQLFTNLVENAFRHGGGPAITVTVSALHTGDGAEVYVDDDGVGIPEEHREKVFAIFERLDPGQDGRRGTGVGLAMCRRIVAGFGAQLDIPPTSHGTRLRLRLPAAAIVRWPTPPAEAGEVAAAPRVAGGGPT